MAIGSMRHPIRQGLEVGLTALRSCHLLTMSDPRYTKRVVEYALRKDLEEYNTNDLQVPWQSWLRHTRDIAPSLEELRADQERRRVISIRAQQYEEAYQDERLQLAAEKDVGRNSANDARHLDTMDRLDLKTSTRAARGKASFSETPAGHKTADARTSTASKPADGHDREGAEASRRRSEMQKSPLSAYRPASSEEFQPEAWRPKSRRR